MNTRLANYTDLLIGDKFHFDDTSDNVLIKLNDTLAFDTGIKQSIKMQPHYVINKIIENNPDTIENNKFCLELAIRCYEVDKTAVGNLGPRHVAENICSMAEKFKEFTNKGV